MSYNSLENYYQVMFALRQHHGWTIPEIEDLIPYERDLFVGMLEGYLEELKEKRKEAERKRR